MKNKASLVLMEQLAMVLVFALTAALCLGIFAAAGRLSEDTARRETAAFLAQNGAELRKRGQDPEAMELPAGYALSLTETHSGIPGLGTGTITVFWKGEPVFILDTGWQEVLP